jgi:hypothetical protein
MCTSIFTLSVDEGAGWTDRQLDVACALTPWFFFTGHIMMFCALFTKLWRLDRVLQFRRSAMSACNALWPLVAFLAITMSILVVHTAIDPWTWERELTKEIPAEQYGQCTSKHAWSFFGPLVGVLFFSELLTLYFAWKTNDVPDDFRDSGAVMYTCFAQLQAWAIGCPMLVLLGYSSADASYFGRIFLIWIFAVSGVAVVVVPKIYRALKIRLNPELRGRPGRRVSVTGVYLDSSTSHASPTKTSTTFGSPIKKVSCDRNTEKHTLLEIPEIENSSESASVSSEVVVKEIERAAEAYSEREKVGMGGYRVAEDVST